MRDLRALLCILLGTVLSACGGTPTDTTKKIVIKRPQTSAMVLVTISGTSPNDIWFAGENGLDSPILHWDGHAFTSVPEPDLSRVDKLWALAPDDVYGIGSVTTDPRANTYNARVIHFDGSSWRAVFTDTVDSAAIAIAATGPNDVWVAANHATVNSRNDVISTVARVIHWDGSNWTAQDVPSSRVTAGSELWAGGPNDVWIRDYTDDVVHFDGTSWHDQNLPQGLQEGLLRETLFGAQIAPHEYYFLVNHVVARWDGVAMDSTNVAQEISDQPVMSGTGATDLWFAGHYCEHYSGGVTGGCQQYTRSLLHWNGQGWTRYVGDGAISDTGNYFASVWSNSPGDVWAVDGAGDSVYHVE